MENTYWSKAFAKYFGLNIAKFYLTIGETIYYFDVEKFRRFVYRKAGLVAGNSDYSQTEEFKKYTLDFLVERHYGRNALKFLDNLLAQELPF